MYNINIGTKVHLRSYTYISDLKKWKELSRRKKRREEKQKNKQKCFFIYIYIYLIFILTGIICVGVKPQRQD